MKKLMIAAAIVCAAVVGQAAQVSWEVGWAYSNDGKEINTYDDGSTVNYWIVNMLGSTDTSGLSVDGSGNLVNSDEYAVVGEGAFTQMGADFAGGTIANGNYLAMVIYDADNKLWGVSNAIAVEGIIAEPPTAGQLMDNAPFQNDPEGYLAATQAVPEPTSGLLLLLGVAGLALRRRRA